MDSDSPDEHRGFLRESLWSLWDDAKGLLLMVLPVVLGAAVGYAAAQGTGLVIGGLAGAALVALYFLWGLVSWLSSGVRRIRGREN